MSSENHHPAIIAWSGKLRAVLELAARAAPSPWSVVLTGPTGVGKGLVAKYMHRLSRADRPWQSFTAGELVESLMGSQLRGHTHGAFTGTRGDSKGVFESARDGTLFLDEIHHLGAPMQVALLAPLGERVLTRIGAYREIVVQCRVIFGSAVPLDALIRGGRLLPDLRYRMGMSEIAIPSLVERRGDILPIADQFLRRLAPLAGLPQLPQWTPGAVRAMLLHSWPGNVREVEERVKRVLMFASGGYIEAVDAFDSPGSDQDLGRVLDETALGEVAQYVVRTVGGSRTEAAAMLGIGRNTITRWLDLGENHRTAKGFPADVRSPVACTTRIGESVDPRRNPARRAPATGDAATR